VDAAYLGHFKCLSSFITSGKLPVINNESKNNTVSKNNTGSLLLCGKLPVLFLLTGQKSAFCPAGATRCTNSRKIWHSRGAHGSTWSCEIPRQSVHGGRNVAPKKVENFTFSANSRPATANPLADFYIFKGFYTSNYPVFQI